MHGDYFLVSSEIRSGLRLITAVGELDELTAPILEHEFTAYADRLPIVIDLTNVAFMSSAGVRTIFNAHAGEEIVLVCPPGGIVHRVLDIVEARKIVSVFDSLPEALANAPRQSANRTRRFRLNGQ